MYLAELRGKLSRANENSEDILTSNVFSFLKYADRALFLGAFLRSLGMDVSPNEALRAEFRFWPRFTDGTEPDVVIEVGNNYALFEAKYLSGFGQGTEAKSHQLLREIEGGMCEAQSLGKDFHLIAITADYTRCAGVFDCIPLDILSKCHWTNWQQVALMVDAILQDNLPMARETRAFAEDLLDLLRRKNLRAFAGTRLLERFASLSVSENTLFFDAAKADYRGAFIGFLRSLEGAALIGDAPHTVFFKGSASFFWEQLATAGHIGACEGHIFYGGYDG